MKQVEGASVLMIDKTSSNNQLLVTLCRNGTHWLSPVGWTDQEKGTLLDCQVRGDETEIQIPLDYSQQIETGDTLQLKCAELGLDEKITWNSAFMPGESVEPVKKKRFFGRFGKKPDVEEVVKPEITTQFRAEEAEKAALAYKEKMRLAEEAREEARRKAEEAAQMAAEAQKAEEERVAEMERAAQAYQEAEQLRQDELRRLEEERLAEEARLAEIARIAEEKRLAEEAARLAEERQAAKDKIRADIKLRTKTRQSLSDRLKTLTEEVGRLEGDFTTQEKAFIELESQVEKANVSVHSQGEAFDSRRSEVEKLQDELSSFQKEEALERNIQKSLSKQISEASSLFKEAEEKAKAANKLVEDRRADLEALKSDDSSLSERLKLLSEQQAEKHNIISEKDKVVSELKEKYETTKQSLSDKTTALSALKEKVSLKGQKLNDIRNQVREKEEQLKLVETEILEHEKAYLKLDAVSDFDDVKSVTEHVKTVVATNNVVPIKTVSETAAKTDEVVEIDSGGVFGGLRRVFGGGKDAPSNDSDKPHTQEGAPNPLLKDNTSLKEVDSKPVNFSERRASTGLVTGLGIGAVALLGTAYAYSKLDNPVFSTQKIAANSNSVIEPISISSLQLTSTADISQERATPGLEVTKNLSQTDEVASDINPVSFKPIDYKSANVEFSPYLDFKAGDTKPEYTKLASTNIDGILSPLGFSEVTDPFHINPSEIKAISKPKSQPIIKKTIQKPARRVVRRPVVNRASQPEITVRERPLAQSRLRPDQVLTPSREDIARDNRAVREVQVKLTDLGYYTGPVNGLRNADFREGLRQYKAVYGLPAGPAFSENFKASLKAAIEAKALANRDIISGTEAALTTNSEPVKTVSLANRNIVLFDTPATVTEIIPQEVDAVPVEEVQVAALNVEAIPTPAPENIIVPAKLTKPVAPEYPSIALRRDILVNVDVEITYDIDETGQVQNARMTSINYDGRMKDKFINAALNATEKQTFDPRTVNGDPVALTGAIRRVKFRVE